MSLYQWGSITGFPESVCYEVKSFLEELPEGVPEAEKQELKAAQLAELKKYLSQHCELTLKFDGTNVGKDIEGSFYGRRHKLGTEVVSYQKVPLLPFRDIDISAVFQDILKGLRECPEVEDFPDPDDFLVFGELMCNQLFDYNEKGWTRTWQPFGAQFICKSLEEGEKFNKILSKAGYSVPEREFNEEEDGRDQVKVRMGLCRKLAEVFARHKLPHPPFVAEGPLSEVVLNMAQWMTEAKGEGVVVNMGGTLKKWKIAEHASETQKCLLRDMVELVREKQAIVDEHVPVVTKIVEALHNVVTSEARSKKKPQKGKKKKGGAGPYVPSEVTAAIESAVSKFDCAEAFFEKGLERAGKPDHKACCDEYKRLLVQEVMSSGDLKCAPDAEAQGTLQVQRAVTKLVGGLYGQWMRKRKTE